MNSGTRSGSSWFSAEHPLAGTHVDAICPVRRSAARNVLSVSANFETSFDEVPIGFVVYLIGNAVVNLQDITAAGHRAGQLRFQLPAHDAEIVRSAASRTSMPPISASFSPKAFLIRSKSMPALLSKGCRQSTPASIKLGMSDSTSPSQCSTTGNPLVWANSKSRRCAGNINSRYIARRHERAMLEAQIVPHPESVGQTNFGVGDLQHVDGDGRVNVGHVANPVGVQRHAGQNALVPAQGVHRIESAEHRGGQEHVLFGTMIARFAVLFQRETPTVAARVDQMRPDVLLPTSAVLDQKIDVLRRAAAVFFPAEDRAVPVADEFRRLAFFDDLFAEIEIGDQIEDRPQHGRDFVAGAADIQSEMIADRFRTCEMALIRPFFRGFSPKHLKQPDAIDRLVSQDSLKSFFAG